MTENAVTIGDYQVYSVKSSMCGFRESPDDGVVP